MVRKTRPLSPVDSAWLHMDDPTNLMMITGMALLDGRLDIERYRRTVAARLLAFDRFRMRVVERDGLLGGPCWEVDPHFDLNAHIHRVALPAPGGMAALQDLLSDLASTPLDTSKPPWQIHLVDDVCGNSAMIMRLHHCIGDGTAMNTMLHRLMDTAPDAPLEPPSFPSEPANAEAGVLSTLLRPARSALGATMSLAHTLWKESTSSLANPLHLADRAAEGLAVAEALGDALLMPADSVTPFKGALGVRKRVAWSQRVPLDKVKRLGKATGAKVNDVLIAAVTGALGTYLLAQGIDMTDLEIRAVVPIDLRPAARAHDLGNQFGLAFLALPPGMPDPFRRVAEIRHRMSRIKRSPEAKVFYGLLNLFGIAPAQIEEPVVKLFASKATAVMTNVAGPPMPLYMAGCRVADMIFWVPQSGRLSMGISILSYDGGVTLGVITDAGLIPHPELIAAGFEEELRHMLEAAHC